jgi:hypothetical protein
MRIGEEKGSGIRGQGAGPRNPTPEDARVKDKGRRGGQSSKQNDCADEWQMEKVTWIHSFILDPSRSPFSFHLGDEGRHGWS